MALDVLQVVPQEEISQLLKLFEKDWPKFYPLKQYVTILDEYKKANVDNPKQNLYRYGDPENGVYIVETNYYNVGKLKSITIYFVYTASEDLSDLKHALMRTSRIPWTTKVFAFEIVFERLVLAVDEVARTKGIAFDMKHSYIMWLLPEPVNCGTVPEEMFLASLDKSHAPEINSNWPYRFPGSEIFLGLKISNNFGLGLFRKTDKKLVCSALSNQSGGIFVLFTDSEFRGKGYADVIVRNMSHELHKRGRIPFGTVLLENTPSHKVFAKIGFQQFTKVYYLSSNELAVEKPESVFSKDSLNN